MNHTNETQYTENFTRVIRAAIGMALILPVISGAGLNPWATFGMSFIGACMVLNAMIGKHTAESILTCGSSFVVAGMMIANSGWGSPTAIAAISITSIASVTVALIGIQTVTARKQSLQQLKVEKVAQQESVAANNGLHAVA